jgi:hypothetical protein
MKRGIIGLVVLALAFVAGPAEADSSHGSVTGVSGVLFNDCLSYPYHYALVIPADAQSWTLDVTALGPDGQVAETDALSNEEPVGMRGFFLCTRPDGFGTYTIHSTFHWQDADDVWQQSALDDSSFTLRKPFTTTSVRASIRRPSYRQLVTYRISSFDERPTGYAPNGLAWVHLEKKAHGQWVRMRGGRAMTHSTGRATVRLRYLRHHHRPVRIRAVTEPTVRYAVSASPMLRLW